MNERLLTVRNVILSWLYRHILKPIFFQHDPEVMHNRMVGFGRVLGKTKLTSWSTRQLFSYRHSLLEQTLHGIHFPNPIGLSGGFDKNGVLTRIIPSVGFGFMEVGSITAHASAGNAKPRMWRFPDDKSILVHLGLNNDGVETIATRLERATPVIPVGTNIAMTNKQEQFGVEEGIADYATSFRRLANIGSYFTINISCPNTYQGEPFSNPLILDKLFTALGGIPTNKPIFLKLSPDLPEPEVDAILEVVGTHRLHGFVCSNLTHDLTRAAGASQFQGGLSGKAQWGLSNRQIAHLRRRVGDKYTIIGVGGIFSAEDAYHKIKLGASLVELITGMIYEGPQLISTINQGLVRLAKKDGFSDIRQAVGKET